MTLPHDPIITKFFANKIESSSTDWPDYLLEIANIFAEFDGDELDKESILDRFRVLSARSSYSLRDPSNFRDEFGAYGPYLGVFHLEEFKGKWRIFLSGAARQYLCTTEPDVESFCRAQLTLFQYPNGAGAVYTTTSRGKLSVRVQANLLKDTLREVRSNLKIVPFRLICKALLAKCEAFQLEPEEAYLDYPEIIALFNDNRTNTNQSPDYEDILRVLQDIQTKNCPSWVFDPYLLTKFKRNFHILTHTGLLIRTDSGLSLNVDSNDKIKMVQEIAKMNNFFSEFNICDTQPDLIQCVKSIIKNSKWGYYYDAANLSAKLLTLLAGEVENGLVYPEFVLSSPCEDTPAATFPPLIPYESSKPSHKKTSTNVVSNPEIAKLKREKANRDHARLVERFATMARLAGGKPKENIFIDMFVDLDGRMYLLEMKSCNPTNLLSQIRKGISQLYEYRYRYNLSDAILCLVLQHPPNEPWLIEYLVKDRNIYVCWLVDEVNIECPTECREILKPLLITSC